MTIGCRNRSPRTKNSRPLHIAPINRGTNTLDNVADTAEVTDARDASIDQSSAVQTDTRHQLRLHQLLGIDIEATFEVEAQVHVGVNETGDEAPIGVRINLVIRVVREQFNGSNPFDSPISNHNSRVIYGRTVTEQDPPGGDETRKPS
jgi:hypothetical protein